MSCARSGSRRPLVVAGLVALLCALSLALAASPAAAHASLVSTDPAEGAVLRQAPDAVTFTFDERVSLTDDGVLVFDARGEPIEANASAVDEVVTADLPSELDDGTYVVTYRVISADGHPIAGSLTFSVGAASEKVKPPDVAAADSGGSIETLLGLVQALGYVGLLIAVGLVVFQCWVLGGSRLTPIARDLLTRVHWAATGLAILAWAAAVPLDGAYQQGLGIHGALRAEAIDLALVGDNLVVLGLISAGLGLGLLAPRARDFATLGAALAIAAPAVIGHTRAYEPVALLVITDGLHLAAGATWLGGLVGLALTLPSLAGRAGDAAAVLTRFSGVAAGLLLLLVVSGTLLAWRIIGSWSDLFGTTYGLLLIIKVGIVAVAVAVALWNRTRLLPQARDAVGHAETQRAAGVVRRAVRLEAVLVVAVLGVTGFLTNQSPGVEPAAVSAPPGVEQGTVGEYQALITLDPGTRGPNTLALQIQDLAGEPVDLFARPEVSIRSSSVALGSLVLSPGGAGTYTASLVFPSSGPWQAQVSFRTSKFNNLVTIVELDVR